MCVKRLSWQISSSPFFLRFVFLLRWDTHEKNFSTWDPSLAFFFFAKLSHSLHSITHANIIHIAWLLCVAPHLSLFAPRLTSYQIKFLITVIELVKIPTPRFHSISSQENFVEFNDFSFIIYGRFSVNDTEATLDVLFARSLRDISSFISTAHMESSSLWGHSWETTSFRIFGYEIFLCGGRNWDQA